MRLRCKICGDIIKSYYRHDFKFCSCGSCYVDGGNDYFRCGYKNKEDVEFIKEKNDENSR